jgi:hypothetical protein
VFILFSILFVAGSMLLSSLIRPKEPTVEERRAKREWACFVETIAGQYKNAEKITLVMDNLNTHVPGSLCETFPPEKAKALWDRFEFVYTPKHGSYSEIVEATSFQGYTESALYPKLFH